MKFQVDISLISFATRFLTRSLKPQVSVHFLLDAKGFLTAGSQYSEGACQACKTARGLVATGKHVLRALETSDLLAFFSQHCWLRTAVCTMFSQLVTRQIANADHTAMTVVNMTTFDNTS